MDSKRSSVVLVVALVVAVVSLVVAVLAASQASSVHRQLAEEVARREAVEKAIDQQIYLAANGESSAFINGNVETASRGFAMKVEHLETLVRSMLRDK